MSNKVVDSGKPAGTCHSGTCTQQATHRLDWDTWANETCDEHTAAWRAVTSPDGTAVKVTPLFRCACCIADADPEGERESERWTLFAEQIIGTTFCWDCGEVFETTAVLDVHQDATGHERPAKDDRPGLFIDELDGTTFQTTPETFTDDWYSYLDWKSEQHIARHYGDCGASLDVYFTPEEGGY
ncbi:hypothetical protein [Streptomyces scabiei]|uniref:hypothetical protein n=1 Tax=Streptomyces scabiei TaxID=1930 RepID=UPI0029A4C4BF|nr:hypothetical protein [Streptomyces scabiei]MDX3520668.1 hypothetical protein [Streptomyces scabiei]